MRRKCKLYRFDSDSGEWKERGAGQTRLLRSVDTAKIRLLMRQEKTLKIRANHFGASLQSVVFTHSSHTHALMTDPRHNAYTCVHDGCFPGMVACENC